MRFWDSSAVVALIVEQPATTRVRALESEAVQGAVWVLSDVEARSAIERLRREGVLSSEQARRDAEDCELVLEEMHRIDLIEAVKQRAKRLLARHALRAGDALQLGAALLVADDSPGGIEFVTLDERLAEVAHREGFRVLP